MNRVPDYAKATNAAYQVLERYDGYLPKIDIFYIILCLPDIKLYTYSDASEYLGCTLAAFLKIAPSEYGFTVYDQKSGKHIIYFNEMKDEAVIRFTLAHELGHALLKHTTDDEISRKEADCFARNILCPVPAVDGFELKTTHDYVDCFQVSEVMANVARQYASSDRYYITKDHYQKMSDKLYCYMCGCTLSELYG